jgi:hypothetical protein
VDAQVSARLSNQLFLQLGSSGGRGVRDYCAVSEKLPELYTTAGSLLVNQQLGQCAISEDWLTNSRAGVLHDPQAGRPPQRHVSVDTGGGASRERGRQQRQLAVGELQRDERDSAGADGPAAGAGLTFQTVNLLEQGHTFPIASIRSTCASARI